MSGKNIKTTATTTNTTSKKVLLSPDDRHVVARRARRTTTTATTSRNAAADENTDDNITTATSSSSLLAHLENKDAFISKRQAKKSSSEAASSTSTISIERILADFIAAQKNTCQADFWKKHSRGNLSRVIIETSCRLSSSSSSSLAGGGANDDDGGGFSLLLEEHTLELLQVCRKLIVQATTITSNNNQADTRTTANTQQQQQKEKSDSLTVAIHTFRALCRHNSILSSSSNNSSKQQESALRLLYHALIAAAEPVFLGAALKKTAASQESDQGKKDAATAASTATIPTTTTTITTTAIHQSLAAYEALGYLLRDYTFHPKEDTENIGNNNHHSSTTTTTTVFRCSGDNDVFPVPVQRSRKKGSSSSSLTLEQVCAIGIQATRTIAKLLLLPCAQEALLCQVTAGRHPSPCVMPSAFVQQLVDCNKTMNNSSNPFGNAAIHLLRFTTLQWMLFQAKNSGGGGSSSNSLAGDSFKQLLSHCKQNHHLLWDAAATVSSSRPEECLRLRQEALLAFLAVASSSDSDNGDDQSTTRKDVAPKMISALRAKNFDTACSFAWKAAVTFVRESTNGPCPPIIDSSPPSSSSSSSLRTFHEAVGVALDSIAAQQPLTVLSYVEYCIHRARHVGPGLFMEHPPTTCRPSPCSSSQSCLFQHLPYPCFHQSCVFDENDNKEQQQQQRPGGRNYGPTLALSLLGSFLDQQLKLAGDDSHDRIPIKLDILSNDFIRSAQHIMKQFQNCEIAQQRPNTQRGVDDTTMRLRLFKLQPVDTLLSTVFHLLETDVWKSHGRAVQALLELAGTVLVDCFGPMAFQLASDACLEEGKRPWTVAIQCFTRGIAIFESLLSCRPEEDHDDHQKQQQERVLQLSQSAQEQLVQHLSGKRIGLLPPTPIIEMAAKNLFNVGRQRQEMQLSNGNHTALPLLSGIQLFTEVTRHAAKPSETIQLSARWAFLAKEVMSQKRHDAAIVSMVSALAYVGVEQASRSSTRASDENDDADAVSLFVFICSQSKDNLPTGLVEEAADGEQNQTRALIAKIILLFAERERSQFTPVEDKKTLPFTAGQVIECLFDDLQGSRPLFTSFEQYSNVPFCLSALVQVMFARGALPSEQILCPKAIMSHKIRIFIGILVRYALSLQLDTWGEGSDFDAAFTEYDFLVRVVASFIRKFLAENETGSSAVTLGAFYVMASVCLVSRHPASNLDGWCCFGSMSKNDDSPDARKFAILSGFAKKYAAKAASTLSCVSGTDNEWALTASAMLPAVSLYQLRLSYMQGKTSTSSLSDLGSLSVDVYRAVDVLTNNESESTLLSISKRCFVSILSRYYDWLSLRGERLNALQIATWNRNMARSLGPTHLSHWLEATTLSQSVRETYLPREHPRQGVQCSDKTSIAVVEVQACRLRSQLLGALAVPELYNVRESLCALLDQLDVLEPNPDPSQVELLIPWVRSTVVSGLADAANLVGELDTALDHYKACLRECQLAAVALGRERRVIPGPSGVSVPFWESVPVSSAILRYCDRQVDCLMRISLVHESLGDYKKATTYAISAVQRTDGESRHCATFPEFIESIQQNPCDNGRERQARRLLLGVKARATAFDIVHNELGTDNMVTESSIGDESLFSADQDLEGILDNLAFNSLLNGFPSHQHTRSFYDVARSSYDQLVHQPQIERLAALLPGRIASSVLYDLKLAEAKSSFSSNWVCEGGRESVVRSNCEEIVRAPAATTSCRAEAFYLLGLLDLGHARESGALAAIWRGNSNLETISCIENSSGHALDRAKASFTAALSMLGPASNLSTRCALRSLALVSGPHGDHKVNADSSCLLIHTSIGSGSRQHVTGALHIDDSCGSLDREGFDARVSAEYIHNMFAALDTSLISEKREIAIGEFLRQLKELTPTNWRYVACTICPTGEMLVSSLSTNADTGDLSAKTACVFPNGNEYGEFEVGAYDQIVKPLDSVIYRMDNTIKTGKNANSLDDAEKREWWNARKTLDLELRTIIETVGEDFFSSEAILSVLDGARSNDDEYKRAAHFGKSRGNLASLFEAATQEIPVLSEPDHENETPPGDMKVAELKEELINMGFEAKTVRKMRKAELVDLVSQERRRRHSKQNDQRRVNPHDEDDSIKQEKGCVILVLDENLHRFPFEGLPILERKIVCRVPSLPFAIAKLAELSTHDANDNGGGKVNGIYTSYVVDPESNLCSTKERLMPFLQSISEKHGGSWKGIAGEAPSPSFIEESLLADNGLFLYFGHGCGKPYFSRKQIESLMYCDQSGDGLRRRIRSSIVLMGCSSGRLESVNRRNAKSITDELPIYYDPEGTALSYLSAGAPCVVGNLWDVTDVDIDRYAMQMLDQFFDKDSRQADSNDGNTPSTVSLAECVAQARSACRMRYLVGCAPVCYGIPVYRG